MKIDQFVEMIQYNEPTFGFHGQEYSICSPDGKFYVTSSDNPADASLVFDSVDALLNEWIIQGMPLKKIVEKIDLNEPTS